MSSLLKNRKVAYLVAILCTFLWGTAFPVIKMGYNLMSIPENDVASKLIFAGARFFLGGVMVYIIGLFIKKQPLKLNKTDITPVVLLALVQTALQYLFSYIGVGYTTASNTSVITACMSFFVVLLAPIFFKNDKLNLLKILGCVVGFAGVIVMNFKGFAGGGISFLGEGFVILSTLCASGGNLITKGFMKDRDPVKITAFQLGLGGLLLLLLGFILGGKVSFNSFASVMVLVYLALVSAVAFTLWTAVLRYHPVSKISVFNLLVPVFGTVWSGILLYEPVLTIENAVALVLVCAGIVIVNLEIKNKRQ